MKKDFQNNNTLDRQSITNYCLLIIGMSLYIVLSIFSPQTTSANTLGLSAAQLILVRITIILPYLLTWAVAVYAFTALGKWLARSSQDDKVSVVLGAVNKGLLWIILGLIITPIIGALKPYATVATPSLVPFITIVVNYLYILPLLLGFWVMYGGIRSLLRSKQLADLDWRSDSPVKTVLVAILGGAYTYLIFTNPNRQLTEGTVLATYYLPDILIALTILLPVVAVWWLGFSVAFMLSDIIPYVAKANAYRAMTKILYGIWSIIFTAILLQALLSLGTSRLLSMGLGLLLPLIYIFVLLQCVGYVLLALGVRTLRKIEAPERA